MFVMESTKFWTLPRLTLCIVLFLSVVCFAAPSASAQNGEPGVPDPVQPSHEAMKSPYAEWADAQARLGTRRSNFIREHYQQMRRDADRLVELAGSIKAYVDQNPNTVLAGEKLKQARKMEDLAYDVRKLMFVSKVRRITISKADPGPNGASAAPLLKLQQAAKMSLELATDLKEMIDHYLEQTNQNTVSVKSMQGAGGKEILRKATSLESLAYVLDHPSLLDSSH
ncbi:MAG TPA: hypothetical protein VKD65_07395 [Candidatus Angelobacter sp.]|nr:hypothetical protein [Candidatus Angelobacter sp.]